jgi:hypothetical protein
MSEIEIIRHHLDAVAGTQLALVTATKLLLSSYQGNSQAEYALQEELERMKSNMLHSSSSDYKIEAFDEAADALLSVLKTIST